MSATTATAPTTTPAPAAPATLEQTGLPVDQIEQLLIKTLYGAEATGVMIAR
jgi:hypothetical protein